MFLSIDDSFIFFLGFLIQMSLLAPIRDLIYIVSFGSS